jgi:predicted ATPase
MRSRARAVESRFEAHHTEGLSSLIGRQQELALLVDRWNQAAASEGQLVLLTGQAGIGKSRIAQAFMDALAKDTHVRVRYQCSPFHTESMLYPTIQQLGRAAAIDVQDTVEVRLEKLERILTQSEAIHADSILSLADLLGIEAEGRYESLELTPQRKRECTLETLVAQLFGLARQRPVLWIIEDVH